MKRIAILGGGSWGTALAIVLSRTHKPHEISLWVRDPELAKSIRRDSENKIYLPGYKLPESVHVTNDAAEALQSTDVMIGAIPAATRATYTGSYCHSSSRAQLSSAPRRVSNPPPTLA